MKLADTARRDLADGPDKRVQDGQIALKTLLLTDLVDSTHLIAEIGDKRAYEAFAHHDRVARDLLKRFRGLEIDKTDGFLLLFEHPVDAVDYALEYHQQLATLSRELGVELKARAGIHLGEVHLRRNSAEDITRGAKPIEVEGLAKPMAARAMALAGGGQTLLTQGPFELARRAKEDAPDRDPRLRWISHGRYRLKGIEAPVPIFEVGLEGSAPLLAPPDPQKARRRRRLGRIAAMALLAAAAVLVLVFQSGRLGAEVRPSVAVLGFKNLSQQPESAWLSTALSEMVSTELAAGGEVRMVSGSRIARMRQELSLREVEPFSGDTLAQIRNNLGTDYVILGSYLTYNRELQLTLSLQSTRRKETLATIPRRGKEEELFDLVSGVGKELRRHLGVGDLQAAESEAARATLSSSPEATRLYSEGLARLRSYDALGARDLLSQAVLADPDYALAHVALSSAWSMLGYERNAEEVARRALELARAQGLPREEVLAIEGRTYEMAADWPKAIETYGLLSGFFPDNVDYGLLLVAVQTNAARGREALETVARLRQLPPPQGDDPRIDLAASAASESLSDFAGMSQAAEVAARRGEAQQSWTLVAEAKRLQGWALRFLGRPGAGAMFAEAQRLASETGDRAQLARIMNAHATQHVYDGDSARGEELFRQAMAIFRELGNRDGLSLILNNLGGLLTKRGDLAAAEKLFREALEVAEEIDSRSRRAMHLESMTQALTQQGNLAEAAAAVREALAIYQEIDRPTGMAWSFYELGRVAFAAGRLDEARGHLEEVLAICEESGNGRLPPFARQVLAEVLLARGEVEAAADVAEQSRATLAASGAKGKLAETELTRSRLLLAQGRMAEAGELARQVMVEFREDGRRDLEALAAATVAAAHQMAGEIVIGRSILARVSEQAAASENATVRLTLALAEVRLRVADRALQDPVGRLTAVESEARELGLVGIELEARLARAEIELAPGGASGTAARQRLEALAVEAEERGFESVARPARGLAEQPS